MAFHMTGIYQVNDRYRTNVIYLVYTCHMSNKGEPPKRCHMTGTYQVYSSYILYIVICRVYTRYIPLL